MQKRRINFDTFLRANPHHAAFRKPLIFECDGDLKIGPFFVKNDAQIADLNAEIHIFRAIFAAPKMTQKLTPIFPDSNGDFRNFEGRRRLADITLVHQSFQSFPFPI